MTSKVAIVTGAGTGIGRAVSLALARHGWKVALAGRRREPLDAVAGEAPSGSTRAVPTDVAAPESVKALFADTVKAWGRVDQARPVLQQVVKSYPESPFAQRAQETLVVLDHR